jgi:eukaryotic-like serine/threonine-protein kinase
MKRRELPVSTTVGDAYRVVRRIGEGARGTVYEAHDLRRNQPCALKLMDGVIAESAEALATFHSQAEIASRPQHPQLLPVLDFGTAATGEPFVITELLDGEDLGARRRRRPGDRFEAPLVGHLIQQAAQALSVAHKQGLYHLGLKPTNLFLVPRADGPDQIQVLDFGLSQVDNALHLEGAARLEDSLPFVSPEQSGNRSDPLDDRCDQWSLACVAWQMLTAAPPFTGLDATALLYQVAFEDPQPDPAAVVPDTVLAVLDRALSKRAEDRFPDILEFGGALEAACGPLLLPKVSARARRRPLAAPNRPPVFLPGMTPRAAEPVRRATAAAPTRVKGLRVRGPFDGSPAVASTSPQVETAAGATPVEASAPLAATTSRWNLRARLAGVDRRRLLLFGVLPAGAAILAMGTWGALRHKSPPVSVERPTRPTIVPLKASSTSTAMKRSRKRARRSRSRKRIAD